MVVINIDAEFGVKYVANIEGRIRECYLIAVTYDKKSHDETPQYILEVAGIGMLRVDIPYISAFEQADFPDGIDSILADSLEDYLQGNFHKYQQLNDTDMDCWDALHELLPQFNFNTDYGLCTYQWDRKELKPVVTYPKWDMWRMDANGFFTDIIDDEYFQTYEDCRNAHIAELELVTF